MYIQLCCNNSKLQEKKLFEAIDYLSIYTIFEKKNEYEPMF